MSDTDPIPYLCRVMFDSVTARQEKSPCNLGKDRKAALRCGNDSFDHGVIFTLEKDACFYISVDPTRIEAFAKLT